MTIEKYTVESDLTKTSERKAKPSSSADNHIFVVHKHSATTLHYYFRLEMEGVLKSWVLPEGPSLNPADKRLAILQEDYPYSYKDFEGSIPEGNDGAGNIIVWDQGTYAPSNKKSKKEPEEKLLGELQEGHLNILLKGKKLKGVFTLVRLVAGKENEWLLIKMKDKYAKEIDVLKKDKSVLTNTTIAALERKARRANVARPKKRKIIITAVSEAKVPFMAPMQAGTTEEPFDDKDWIFETKYDGYRTVAVLNSEIHLYSRNHLSFDSKFQPILEELKKITQVAVLDGEVVVEDASGKSSFQLLQNYISSGEGILKYYVFDIMNLDGFDVTKLTLLERKKLVQIMLDKYKVTNVIYSEHVSEKGISFFREAEKNKAEGIIAKRADNIYLPGKRTNQWLKIKIVAQEEAIIIGITKPKNSRSYLGSLLLAQYDGSNLRYIGRCGTGFGEEALEDLNKKLIPYFTDTPIVQEKTATKLKVQWIDPKYVCQVKYTEWSKDNLLRDPVYLGLRIDKTPAEVQFSSNEKINARAEAMVSYEMI